MQHTLEGAPAVKSSSSVPSFSNGRAHTRSITLRIDDNIPIPNRAGESGLSQTLRTMKVRQSFTYPKKKRASVAPTARRMEVKIVTATVSKDKIRVWRVS